MPAIDIRVLNGRRLSAFVQISALFQFYITDIVQTSAPFEVRKGRHVLLLQSEAEDMHCKQADSATLKYLLFNSMLTILLWSYAWFSA